MHSSETAPAPARPDPRVIRSEIAIQQALLESLGSGRHFNSLTVSEIAVNAGVTRKTFYARFGSLDQVVNRMVENLFTPIAAGLDDEMLKIPLADDSLALTVFRACEQHQAVLAPLISQCPAGLFLEPVGAVTALLLDRVMTVNGAPLMSEAEKAYLVASMASMVHGVLSVWARREFSEPAEWVATLIDTLLADGLQKLVTQPLRGSVTVPRSASACVPR